MKVSTGPLRVNTLTILLDPRGRRKSNTLLLINLLAYCNLNTVRVCKCRCDFTWIYVWASCNWVFLYFRVSMLCSTISLNVQPSWVLRIDSSCRLWTLWTMAEMVFLTSFEVMEASDYMIVWTPFKMGCVNCVLQKNPFLFGSFTIKAVLKITLKLPWGFPSWPELISRLPQDILTPFSLSSWDNPKVTLRSQPRFPKLAWTYPEITLRYPYLPQFILR